MTDGHGGIKIYYGTDPRLGIPIVKNSVTTHERSHILDELNQNNAIANDQLPGLLIEQTSVYDAAESEIKASSAQLDYLDRAINDPSKYHIDPQDIPAIKDYRDYVNSYLLKNLDIAAKCTSKQ